MTYKQGKIIDVYNNDGNQKVILVKFNRGYRVTLYQKKTNVWKQTRQKETTLKKYAERRLIEYLQQF